MTGIKPMTWAVSRNHLRNEFPEELAIEHKIAIFADRVKGSVILLRKSPIIFLIRIA